jgi:hypothetical protein
VSYIAHSLDVKLCCWIGDDPADLTLDLWTDADWANDKDAKSVSGVFSAIAGRNSFAVLSGSSTKQTSIATSTPEAEIVAAYTGIKAVGIPALSLWETLLGRKAMKVQFQEDNEACLAIMRSGKAPTMRHVSRTQKIDIGFLHDQWDVSYTGWSCHTHLMCADIFTKPFLTKDRLEWARVRRLIAHFTPAEFNEFSAQLVHVVYQGDSSLLEVKLPNEAVVQVRMPSIELQNHQNLLPGALLRIAVSLQDTVVLSAEGGTS